MAQWDYAITGAHSAMPAPPCPSPRPFRTPCPSLLRRRPPSGGTSAADAAAALMAAARGRAGEGSATPPAVRATGRWERRR